MNTCCGVGELTAFGSVSPEKFEEEFAEELARFWNDNNNPYQLIVCAHPLTDSFLPLCDKMLEMGWKDTVGRRAIWHSGEKDLIVMVYDAGHLLTMKDEFLGAYYKPRPRNNYMYNRW